MKIRILLAEDTIVDDPKNANDATMGMNQILGTMQGVVLMAKNPAILE